jgi:magnesium chelatase family protein
VPGEITLAHNGVLFLDEICEFDKAIIETLRIPMEERSITHFRKGGAYRFPCDFQLVMAANPCPCGYYGDPDHPCRCSEKQLEYYRRKLSGPIIDRVDMRISMEKVKFDELQDPENGNNISSADMRRSVTAALEFAKDRGRSGYNALLEDRDIERVCRLGLREKKFMKQAYESLGMSPRSYKKTLKVARTIADIDRSEDIHEHHLAEALSYRTLERIN